MTKPCSFPLFFQQNKKYFFFESFHKKQKAETLIIGFQLSILSIPYTQNTISLWKFKNTYIFNKILS